MKPINRSDLRLTVLTLMWALPMLIYFIIGGIAIYQTGWSIAIVILLPVAWLASWITSRVWKVSENRHRGGSKPIAIGSSWTDQDRAAIEVVRKFCDDVTGIDAAEIINPTRLLRDAQDLASALAVHYYADRGNQAWKPLTLVEVLSAIHLAVEDLERWTRVNVPGSGLITLGQLHRIPAAVRSAQRLQKWAYWATAIYDPSRVLTYPLWQRSGNAAVEIQTEMSRRFYDSYLRQLGFYLIEMYSGRLSGGSDAYRMRFGDAAAITHAAGDDVDRLHAIQTTPVTVAVMGQVNAGKSSLINRLRGDRVTTTSMLPETKQVRRIELNLPDVGRVVTLLDTPGYGEADADAQQIAQIDHAAKIADVVLLVMAANTPARGADVRLLDALQARAQLRPRLRRPVVIAVVTHIDLLSPRRHWQPPHDWRHPIDPKSESIAAAVAYLRETFGDRISGYACVNTGDVHPVDDSVQRELIPELLNHLDAGHRVAVLRAFHDQLRREHLQRLPKQVWELARIVWKTI